LVISGLFDDIPDPAATGAPDNPLPRNFRPLSVPILIVYDGIPQVHATANPLFTESSPGRMCIPACESAVPGPHHFHGNCPDFFNKITLPLFPGTYYLYSPE
jgi:hypothetical protein